MASTMKRRAKKAKASPSKEARATWLDWDDGGGTVETRMSSTAGLDAHSALIRDFRRFESGGLFTTLGQEKEAARRAARAFAMTPVSGLKQLDREFVVVPKNELRELASLEEFARGRRRFVDDCEDVIARARMIGAERYPSRESDAMKERAVRPWRRGVSRSGVSRKLASSTGPGLSGRLRRTDLHTRLAVVTGSWRAYRERQRWHARMAETELMAFEDGYCRCAWRAPRATARLERYVALVAQYGVPFGEDEFGALGARAGLTFQALVDRGARVAAHVVVLRADVPARRDRGATLFQTRYRAYFVRKRWVPILHLRLACGKMRPMKIALSHWRKCILRTVKTRKLINRVKYGGVRRIIQAWRKLVGEEHADDAVDRVIAMFADELVAEDVGICSHESRSSSTFCADPPSWMDANWYLQKTSYESHVRLAAQGVLPRDLFEDSHREQMHNRTATKIQRLARGVFGRNAVREVRARHPEARDPKTQLFFYLNIVTKARGRPARLVPRLFPGSARKGKAWAYLGAAPSGRGPPAMC
ncbi:hypothetical protein JL722_14250 [Aureococcus anophagefferens]|nr:hypothetical protein JL722_14250 [Aureococcus anophagefferens]